MPPMLKNEVVELQTLKSENVKKETKSCHPVINRPEKQNETVCFSFLISVLLPKLCLFSLKLIHPIISRSLKGLFWISDALKCQLLEAVGGRRIKKSGCNLRAFEAVIIASVFWGRGGEVRASELYVLCFQWCSTAIVRESNCERVKPPIKTVFKCCFYCHSETSGGWWSASSKRTPAPSQHRAAAQSFSTLPTRYTTAHKTHAGINKDQSLYGLFGILYFVHLQF